MKRKLLAVLLILQVSPLTACWRTKEMIRRVTVEVAVPCAGPLPRRWEPVPTRSPAEVKINGVWVRSTRPTADERCHREFARCLEAEPAAELGRQIEGLKRDNALWEANCRAPVAGPAPDR